MASLSITKNYSDGNALTEAHLDTAYDSVETYINARNNGGTPWDAVASAGTLTITGASTFTGGVVNLFSYRRPNLIYSSATAVNVENNTGTAHQTTIVFPDGTVRSVTEDVSATHKYRQFIITATAEFTSGTEDSGLRSGLTEATNTWYAIYAVKSTINAANFVLAGDTTLPLQANFSTLNTRYGTNGWVYLGVIRNGNNSGATGDIISFVQSNGFTNFRALTTASSSGLGVIGLRLAGVAAGTASLTYTYAAGTGTTEIPNHISTGTFLTAAPSSSGVVLITDPSTLATFLDAGSGNTTTIFQLGPIFLTNGLTTSYANSAGGKDILLVNYIDPLLMGGINPLL